MAQPGAAQPSPPGPCGTLDLTSPLTQHCFPEDGACAAARNASHVLRLRLPELPCRPCLQLLRMPSALGVHAAPCSPRSPRCPAAVQAATTSCAASTSKWQRTPIRRTATTTLWCVGCGVCVCGGGGGGGGGGAAGHLPCKSSPVLRVPTCCGSTMQLHPTFTPRGTGCKLHMRTSGGGFSRLCSLQVHFSLLSWHLPYHFAGARD